MIKSEPKLFPANGIIIGVVVFLSQNILATYAHTEKVKVIFVSVLTHWKQVLLINCGDAFTYTKTNVNGKKRIKQNIMSKFEDNLADGFFLVYGFANDKTYVAICL